MNPSRLKSLIALALLASAGLLTGCETTTTSKGFTSGYNYHKPGREPRKPVPVQDSSDSAPYANAGDPPKSSDEPQLPDFVQDLGQGLGNLLELITPPPPGAASASSQQESIDKGMIPNNFTGVQNIKDQSGNTVRVHFDRGRIIKKELIPAGSDKPASDAPRVYKTQ